MNYPWQRSSIDHMLLVQLYEFAFGAYHTIRYPKSSPNFHTLPHLPGYERFVTSILVKTTYTICHLNQQ